MITCPPAPNLPQSRDTHPLAPENQVRICTQFTSHFDRIIIEEKLDGDLCTVTKINSELIPLTITGHRAATSPIPRHWLFAAWVQENNGRIRTLLKEKEWVWGQWLAQAFGTEYQNVTDPFVPVDILKHDGNPLNRWVFALRLHEAKMFGPPQLLPHGPMPPEDALQILHDMNRFPKSVGPPEGLIYHVERYGEERFRAQYVRPHHVPFQYAKTGASPMWNWLPKEMGL